MFGGHIMYRFTAPEPRNQPWARGANEKDQNNYYLLLRALKGLPRDFFPQEYFLVERNQNNYYLLLFALKGLPRDFSLGGIFSYEETKKYYYVIIFVWGASS